MYNDPTQFKVSILHLMSTPPARIAEMLELPAGEVKKRVVQAEEEWQEELNALPEERKRAKWARWIQGAELRKHFLYLKHQEGGDDQLGVLRELRAEDKWQAELESNAPGGRTANPEVADLIQALRD